MKELKKYNRAIREGVWAHEGREKTASGRIRKFPPGYEGQLLLCR